MPIAHSVYLFRRKGYEGLYSHTCRSAVHRMTSIFTDSMLHWLWCWCRLSFVVVYPTAFSLRDSSHDIMAQTTRVWNATDVSSHHKPTQSSVVHSVVLFLLPISSYFTWRAISHTIHTLNTLLFIKGGNLPWAIILSDLAYPTWTSFIAGSEPSRSCAGLAVGRAVIHGFVFDSTVHCVPHTTPGGELSCSALPAAKRFFCYFQFQVENGE